MTIFLRERMEGQRARRRDDARNRGPSNAGTKRGIWQSLKLGKDKEEIFI
jgi:hypothetical protein